METTFINPGLARQDNVDIKVESDTMAPLSPATTTMIEEEFDVSIGITTRNKSLEFRPYEDDKKAWRLTNYWSVLLPTDISQVRYLLSSPAGEATIKLLEKLEIIKTNDKENTTTKSQSAPASGRAEELAKQFDALPGIETELDYGRTKKGSVRGKVESHYRQPSIARSDEKLMAKEGLTRAEATKRERINTVNGLIKAVASETKTIEPDVSEQYRLYSARERRTHNRDAVNELIKAAKTRGGDLITSLCFEYLAKTRRGYCSTMFREILIREMFAGEKLELDMTTPLFWLLVACIRKQSTTLIVGFLFKYFMPVVAWNNLLTPNIQSLARNGFDEYKKLASNRLTHALNGNIDAQPPYVTRCHNYYYEISPGSILDVNEEQDILDMEVQTGLNWSLVYYLTAKPGSGSPQPVWFRVWAGSSSIVRPCDFTTGFIKPGVNTSAQMDILPGFNGYSTGGPQFAALPDKWIGCGTLSGICPQLSSHGKIYMKFNVDATDCTDEVRLLVLVEYNVPTPTLDTVGAGQALPMTITTSPYGFKTMMYTELTTGPNVSNDIDVLVLANKNKPWGPSVATRTAINDIVQNIYGVTSLLTRVPEPVFTPYCLLFKGTSIPILADEYSNDLFTDGKVIAYGDLAGGSANIKRTVAPQVGDRYFICIVSDSNQTVSPYVYDMRESLGLDSTQMHAVNGNIRRRSRRDGVYAKRKARVISQTEARALLNAILIGSVDAGFAARLQAARNRLQHALNGNTTWEETLKSRPPHMDVPKLVTHIQAKMVNPNSERGTPWNAQHSVYIYDPNGVQATVGSMINIWSHFIPLGRPNLTNVVNEVQALTAQQRTNYSKYVSVASVFANPTADDAIADATSENISAWLVRLQAANRPENPNVEGFNMNWLAAVLSGKGTVGRKPEDMMLKLMLIMRLRTELTPQGLDYDTDLSPYDYCQPASTNFSYTKVGELAPGTAALHDAALDPGHAVNPVIPTSIVTKNDGCNAFVTLEVDRFDSTSNLPAYMVPNAWCQRFGSGKALAILMALVFQWPVINWPCDTNLRTNANVHGLVTHAAWAVDVPGERVAAFIMPVSITQQLPSGGGGGPQPDWVAYHGWGVPRLGATPIGANAADAIIPTVSPLTPAAGINPATVIASWWRQITLEDVRWVLAWFVQNFKIAGSEFDAMYELSVYLTANRSGGFMLQNPLASRALTAGINSGSVGNLAAQAALGTFDGMVIKRNLPNAQPLYAAAWVHRSGERSWTVAASGYLRAKDTVKALDGTNRYASLDVAHMSGAAFVVSWAYQRAYATLSIKMGVSAQYLRAAAASGQIGRMGKVIPWLRKVYASQGVLGGTTIPALIQHYSHMSLVKCSGSFAAQRIMLPNVLEFSQTFNQAGNYVENYLPAAVPDWVWCLDEDSDYFPVERPPKVAMGEIGAYGWTTSDMSYAEVGNNIYITEADKAALTLGSDTFTQDAKTHRKNLEWLLRMRHAEAVYAPFGYTPTYETVTGTVLLQAIATEGQFFPGVAPGEINTTSVRVFAMPAYNDTGAPFFPTSGNAAIKLAYKGSAYGGRGVPFMLKVPIQTAQPINAPLNKVEGEPDQPDLDGEPGEGSGPQSQGASSGLGQ